MASTKDKIFRFHLTDKERLRFEKGARKAEETMSQFARKAISERCERLKKGE